MTERNNSSGLEIATTVFDGWDNIPVPISDAKLFRDGKWEPINPNNYVAVNGQEGFVLPEGSLFWNVEHGNTGWWPIRNSSPIWTAGQYT